MLGRLAPLLCAAIIAMMPLAAVASGPVGEACRVPLGPAQPLRAPALSGALQRVSLVEALGPGRLAGRCAGVPSAGVMNRT